jgi:hypothetical protein
MPPAVIAAGGLIAAGMAGATLKAVAIAAVVGAAIGGITAAIKGGDILDGALMGVGVGAIGAGAAALAAPASGAASGATTAATTAAPAATGAVTEGAAVGGAMFGGMDVAAATSGLGSAANVGSTAASGLLQSVTPPPQNPAPPPVETKGLFSQFSGWVKENPKMAEMIGGTLGGIGENWSQSNAMKQQSEAMLQAQRERFGYSKPDWGNHRLVPMYTPLPNINQTAQYFEGLHPAKQGGN